MFVHSENLVHSGSWAGCRTYINAVFDGEGQHVVGNGSRRQALLHDGGVAATQRVVSFTSLHLQYDRRLSHTWSSGAHKGLQQRPAEPPTQHTTGAATRVLLPTQHRTALGDHMQKQCPGHSVWADHAPRSCLRCKYPLPGRAARSKRQRRCQPAAQCAVGATAACQRERHAVSCLDGT